MNTAIWVAVIGSPALTVAATLPQYFINRRDRKKGHVYEMFFEQLFADYDSCRVISYDVV